MEQHGSDQDDEEARALEPRLDQGFDFAADEEDDDEILAIQATTSNHQHVVFSTRMFQENFP